tara:strand:+ start:3935 stop:4987 length:1053 start_codon:yes stop_codon:yes gene_type:complete
MSAFSEGEAYDDNPFVFFMSDEYIINPQQTQEMPNPLRAMYEDLAPLLLRSPPSKRYPQMPTGMKDWDVLTDPISELVYTSAVPDPIIGGTLQRVMRPTVEGKEGLATHLNIIVDCSSSMGDGTYYGVSPTGFPLAGYHLAQICTAMMIAQAELAKDTFSVWGFNNKGFTIWDGPSQEHGRAIDYFLDLTPQQESPFKPHNGTKIYAGLDRCVKDLKGYDFDQSVTVVIMDGALRTVDGGANPSSQTWANATHQLFNTAMEYNDEDLRKMGPVFYVVVGSADDQDELDLTLKCMRGAISKYYGREMEGCCLDFALECGEDGNMKEFGGALVEMAQVNAGLHTNLKPCPRI